MDLDGQFDYSSTISVEATLAEGQVAVFPNPVTSQLNVRAANASTYRIINGLGAVVLEGTLVPGLGLNVSSLKTGTYMISLSGGSSKATTRRFVKQ